MKAKNILNYINNPQNISNVDVKNIDKILSHHPYFQIGQLLLAKGLLNIDSIRYNRQLRKAAIYSFDRKKLFRLITLNNSKDNKYRVIEKNESKSTNQELKISKNLQFEENENYSFSDWLKLLKTKKIKRKEQKITENFLQKKPNISSPINKDFFNASNTAKESLIEDTNLVTPTLAKVYQEQGHYEKAISTYKKLILKYPEKNSLFASQIKLINKLNKK